MFLTILTKAIFLNLSSWLESNKILSDLEKSENIISIHLIILLKSISLFKASLLNSAY